MGGSYRSIVIADSEKRLVEGFANVDCVDRQNDVVPTDAMKRAMLEYMGRGGIVLLSHENKPVGKILQWDVQKPFGSPSEGIHIIAEIYSGNGMGDIAWKMLNEKMLTGFSIGGIARNIEEVKDKSAIGGVARKLADIELNEISLVQIPANQLATVETLSVAKSAHEDRHSHKQAGTKEEAERVAQTLKQEGKVVYRVIQADDGWCVDYGQPVNPANETGVKLVDERFREMERKTAEKNRVPVVALAQDPEFDSNKVGPTIDGTLTDEDMEKPVESQSQWGWLAVHRPDLLHQWQHEHKVSRSSLPVHAKSVAVPNEDDRGICDYCGDVSPVAGDKYGRWICDSCGEETKELEIRFGKKSDSPFRCPHCGSETIAPHPNAPNPRDYRWCPTCEQHRRFSTVVVGDRKHEPVELKPKRLEEGNEVAAGVEKKPRDGQTSDANIGESGLGRESGFQMEEPEHYSSEGAYNRANAYRAIHDVPHGERPPKTVTIGGAKHKVTAPRKEAEGINSGKNIDKSMAKPVTAKKEPVVDEEEKSDTEILPYSDEEKAEGTAMPPKVLNEETHEDEEPHSDEEKGTIPVPHKTTAEDFTRAMKSIDATLKALNGLLTKVLTRKAEKEEDEEEETEKANYSSRPKNLQSNYKTPPEDGPTSDGVQAPKITQSDNPHSKPFGKGAEEITKRALGGAANGSIEGIGMQDEKYNALEGVLKGRMKLSQVSRKLKGV